MTTTPRKLSPRSQAAWEAFQARIAELGATLLEPEWLGSVKPHRVRCAQEHDCTPRPNSVQQGGGICRTCVGNDPKAAEMEFRARLAELGAILLEPAWLGTGVPHRVRCAQGHDCTPRPNHVKQGDGICRTCARNDSAAAEAAFRIRLAELGAILLEPKWLGSGRPHRVRCAERHLCTPRPNNVQRGAGICALCAGKAWDALYVVADEWGELVKVGITSGDPRLRLTDHRRKLGLGRVLRLVTGLPDGVAPELERYVLKELKAAGVSPVWGRETFYGPRALTRMLRLIDHHPAVRQASQDEPDELLQS
ncbi:hypothetical protein ABTX34_17190 [Streptomyces sp. NPDC096538]|uniref:hypothetical protein n=1 Tax=Streptomyces sp. NPDC096538 TaxID=3155427 RepID=UPI00331DCBD8